MQEKGLKAGLFGSVPVARATGGHTPNPDWLQGPLEGASTVVRHFCRGCGLSEEVDDDLAHLYAEQAGVEWGANVPPGSYFESAGCYVCDGDASVVEVRSFAQ